MLSAELVRCVLIWLQPTAPLRLVPVQGDRERHPLEVEGKVRLSLFKSYSSRLVQHSL
jgi:hypothetical protein